MLYCKDKVHPVRQYNSINNVNSYITIMEISLNYRFLIGLGLVLALGSGAVCLLLVQLLWLPQEQLQLWGQRSMATYLFSYSVLFGFLLGWLATKATRRALRTNQVLPLHWHLKSQTLIDRLPSRTFNRAFMFALAGAVIAAIMVVLLELQNLYYMPYTDFLTLAAVYAICMALAITTMAVYRALGDKTLRHSKI